MRIGGFQLPKINLGKIVGGTLGGIKDSLKKAAGDFFKTGFESFKKTLGAELGKLFGLSKPPAAIGTKAPSMPSGNTGAAAAGGSSGVTKPFNNTGSSDSGGVRSRIEHELGAGATKGWENMPQSAKDDLERQAALQRASRTTQMMTNLLQALHEMNKGIIQNFRA